MDRMITADVGDTSQFSATNSVTISTAQKRTGSKSFAGAFGSTTTMDVYVTGRADYYVRAALFITGLDTTNTHYIDFRETNLHVRIKCNADGTISALRDTTILGTTSSPCLTTNTWYCIEVYCKVHDSTGAVTVKVNGVQVLALTSQDTRNGDTVGQISVIRIGKSSNSSALFYVDDIRIRDDGWPGTGGNYVLTVNGAGDDSAWTASSGNAWECIDELPPSFTDYIYASASVLNTKSTFTLSDMSIVPANIAAVEVLAYGKLDAAGSGNVRAIARSSSASTSGSSVALDTSGIWAEHTMLVDPNGGGAWNLSAVNALQIGVETI